jgi:hypothetical protein
LAVRPKIKKFESRERGRLDKGKGRLFSEKGTESVLFPAKKKEKKLSIKQEFVF